MPIYTKRGDKGKTSLYVAKKVSKSDKNISAIGSVDETVSYIGVILSYNQDKPVEEELLKIQNNLMIINAILAGSKVKFPKQETKKLEVMIDKMEKTLPVLEGFILPGGTLIGSQIMYLRTLVRKSEREIVGFSQTNQVYKNSTQVLSYINRLSDYLFVLARYVNKKSGYKELIWKMLK